MVPPSSVKISRVPTYLICQSCVFVYGTITLYRGTFQNLLLTHHQSATPRSLAATRGISVDFFSSGYLDVSVPQVRLYTLWIQVQIPLKKGGFPHSEIVGYSARLPAPPRLSQAPTSFFASSCQGIHRMRLVTWPYKSSHFFSTLHQCHYICLYNHNNVNGRKP